MPQARLVEQQVVQPIRRGRQTIWALEDRTDAKRWLLKAKQAGKALELTLEDSERDETIKEYYRSVAREAQLTVRFQTEQRRTYRNRRGAVGREAAVLIVLVS